MQVARSTIAAAAIGGLVAGLLAMSNTPLSAGDPEAALASAAEQGLVTFVLFHRAKDEATDAMYGVVRAVADAHADRATFVTVRVGDAAQKQFVARYDVARAPMPLVLAIHPNGAVVGGFPREVAEADLLSCFVSPMEAEVLKSLQADRLALVCLRNSPRQALPRGVGEFRDDPHYAERVDVLTLDLSDPAEEGFLEKLKIDPAGANGTTVFFAPPGVLVGAFPSDVTGKQLAEELAAAGKCCEDENCKHNRQTRQREPRRNSR